MIRHIVVIDSKRGVAKNGDQPVHIAADLAYFKDKTTTIGGNILMGRTTYEVIGLLNNRQNFIATHNMSPIAGASVVSDVAGFLKTFKEDIWVIGGASLYAATLDLADELYVTEIDADLGCDQFYPEFTDDFTLLSSSELQIMDELRYNFCIYTRVR